MNGTVYILEMGTGSRHPEDLPVQRAPSPELYPLSRPTKRAPCTAHTRTSLVRAHCSPICLTKVTQRQSTPGWLPFSSRQLASAPLAQSSLGHPSLHLPQHLAVLPSTPCMQSPRAPWLVPVSVSTLEPQYPLHMEPQDGPSPYPLQIQRT